MLTPPDDLPERELVAGLVSGWGLHAHAVDYRPVGWGSHHWAVTARDGRRWFVTVDDLAPGGPPAAEPPATVFGRLRSALAAARALRDAGADFVVAPVPSRDGHPVRRLGPQERFAVAVYPHVEGRSHAWGQQVDAEHAHAVLDMVVRVHAAPAQVRDLAPVEDLAVPQRHELEAALAGRGGYRAGPYARRLAELVAEHAGPIRAALDRHDERVRATLPTSGPGGGEAGGEVPAVLTHGEPHPGNTMHGPDGFLLIDWDTARVGAPERDLWLLDPGDGSALAAYEAMTGVRPRRELVELYRRRWDLADVALDVARFRRPHSGGAEDEEAWRILCAQVAAVATPGAADGETPAGP